jgi:hypothetical protein
LLVATFLFLPRVSFRGKMIAIVLICASIDWVVTFWFDHAFHLKLFNASFI